MTEESRWSHSFSWWRQLSDAGYRGGAPVMGLRGTELPQRVKGGSLAQLVVALRQPVLGSSCHIRSARMPASLSLHSRCNQRDVQNLAGKEEKRMRATRHNGRVGKHGVYNPNHNDRQFNLEHSDHIDEERTPFNIYWDCIQGFTTHDQRADPANGILTFDDVEDIFYAQRYASYVEGQNARNEKSRHPERNRSTTDIRKNPKTCPEETLYQIGNIDAAVSDEQLLEVVTDFFNEMNEKFGDIVHTLDWSLHVDETTPHIHERHVFDYTNKYGEIEVQQEKALEELGIPLPHPDKKRSKTNSRKMTFDALCRTMLLHKCNEHGIKVEWEPEFGGKEYMEKMDFIIAKQKERLARLEQEVAMKNQTIQELNERIGQKNDTVATVEKKLETTEAKLETTEARLEDTEALISEITDLAYDKACEVVTDTVCMETRHEDLQIISDLHVRETEPGKHKWPGEKKLVDDLFGKVETLIRNAAARVAKKIRMKLKDSKTAEANKEVIRSSVRQKLAEAKKTSDARNQEKRTIPKKREHNNTL